MTSGRASITLLCIIIGAIGYELLNGKSRDWKPFAERCGQPGYRKSNALWKGRADLEGSIRRAKKFSTSPRSVVQSLQQSRGCGMEIGLDQQSTLIGANAGFLLIALRSIERGSVVR